MRKRSDKWPSIKVNFARSETGKTIKVTLTRENALALATEILWRTEDGHAVQLKFAGEKPRTINVKSL